MNKKYKLGTFVSSVSGTAYNTKTGYGLVCPHVVGSGKFTVVCPTASTMCTMLVDYDIHPMDPNREGEAITEIITFEKSALTLKGSFRQDKSWGKFEPRVTMSIGDFSAVIDRQSFDYLCKELGWKDAVWPLDLEKTIRTLKEL